MSNSSGWAWEIALVAVWIRSLGESERLWLAQQKGFGCRCVVGVIDSKKVGQGSAGRGQEGSVIAPIPGKR